MSAISLLCEIVCQDGKAPMTALRNTLAFCQLKALDFVKPGGLATSLVCEACDAPHDAEIVYQDESYGHYCPELGFVPTQCSDIETCRANLEPFLSAVSRALGCKHPKPRRLSGSSWRVGRCDSQGGEIAVYFHPSLEAEADISALEAILGKEVKARYTLVLTAKGTAPVPAAHVVELAEIVAISQDASGVEIDIDPGELVGAPRLNGGGAPNQWAALLVPLIKARAEAGIALAGLNEEARVLQQLCKEKHGRSPKSLNTAKGYLSQYRTGQ